MRHELSKKFFQYWESCWQDGSLPKLANFSPNVLESYNGCGLALELKGSDIQLAFSGSRNVNALTSDLVGSSIADLFPPALKALQVSLVMPCFKQGVGMIRTSRVWFGHRHKDVEWLLLPVFDDENENIACVGVTVTFVEHDKRDYVTVGSEMIERIIRQNFLSTGKDVDLSVIDSHSWAVLDAMGAYIAVDDEVLGHATAGMLGEAGPIASKVAHANVLAVAHPNDFGKTLARIGARYNLKMVGTAEEARAILKSDMIDVLVTTERVDDIAGIKLIREAQAASAYTACVMMLDRSDEVQDSRVLEDGRFVQHLVKPVGEFALRQALDDANEHVTARRRAVLDNPK